MAQTEADVLALELERTEPTVALLFEREDTYLSSIEKRPAEIVSSRDMRVPLEIKPGGRVGHYSPDGGDLGRGDAPKFEKATVPVVHIKFGVEWTRKSDLSTDEKRKAVLSNFRHLQATSLAEFRRHLDSLCMTAGNGVLGTVSAVSTGGGKDTLTLDSDGFGIRLLRDGQFHSIYDSGLTTRRAYSGLGALNGEGPIELYDIDAKQIRVNSSTGAGPTTQVGDKVVFGGLTATPPVSLLGVAYHHNDASSGTWLGLDRAVYPNIRANKIDAASAGLALPFARRLVNKIGNKVGKQKKLSLKAWLHPCQAQAYEETAQAVSVLNDPGSGKKIDMYYGDNMQLAGVPCEQHFSWNMKRIDFVAKEVWGRSEIKEIGYYTDKQGRKFFEARSTDGGVAAADIFYFTVGFNTYVNNPIACGYIANLAVPTGY